MRTISRHLHRHAREDIEAGTFLLVGRPKPHRDVRGSLGRNTFETVHGSMSWMTLDVGALSHASCRSSCRRVWLRAAATAVRRVSPHGDVRGGLGNNTFETVCGSLSRRDEAEGRPASKAAPRLARARQPTVPWFFDKLM